MLQVGHTIDKRYEILETLGQGGMGRVYRVRHALLDRPFALKELTCQGPDAEDQFLQEARILAGLHHPSLPRVTDYFLQKGRSYLVMDYVPGEDLQAMLDARGKPFGEADVLPWLRQLLDALCYVHVRQVTHRDIKPANLKVTPEGRLVLVDFGIAKAGTGGAGPGRTAFGAKGCYTPYLAAPEQIMGQATGPRTDLFAVGATFAYLLTGQLPPTAAGLPAPLGPVIARALAADPGGRWADAAAMGAALAPAAVALLPVAPQAGVQTPGLTTRRDIRR